jgi:SPP1 family holin
MPDKRVIARLIVFIFTFFNAVLVAAGRNKIDIADNLLYEAASYIALFIVGLWNYWKNNSFTPEAKKADEYMKELKGEKDEH